MEEDSDSAEEIIVEDEDVGDATFTRAPQEKVKIPPMPVESEEGLAVLHDRRLDSDRDFDPLADLLPSPDVETPEDDQEQRSFPTALIIRWALISVGIIAITTNANLNQCPNHCTNDCVCPGNAVRGEPFPGTYDNPRT